MLSREDNETLVRVGPGTAMGDLMRRYWIPALLVAELPEPDGAPVRLRLLGEDLVAFRDSGGNVGVLEEHCPHRRASLALGANENGGLRCLYHGWKFAVDGECLEAPAEPPQSRICQTVRAKACLTREAGGMVWVYMGPADQVPVFPEYDWLGMPPENAVAFKIRADCNYAQAVEGTIDSAHAGILHREQPWHAPAKYPHERDLSPKIECDPTPYGMRYAGVRRFGEKDLHVRVTQVILPFTTLIPPIGHGPAKHRRMANVFVPRDDESTWHIQWFFDETQPIDVAYRIEEGGIWIDKEFRKELNIDNWYKQDREWMKSGMFSGIRGVVTQDHAVNETQGKILDRTKEHLGASDVAVVTWRLQMIRAARAFAESGTLPEALTADFPWGEVRAETIVVPESKDWKDEVVRVESAA